MERKEAAVLRDCKYNFFLWEIFFNGVTTLMFRSSPQTLEEVTQTLGTEDHTVLASW